MAKIWRLGREEEIGEWEKIGEQEDEMGMDDASELMRNWISLMI